MGDNNVKKFIETALLSNDFPDLGIWVVNKKGETLYVNTKLSELVKEKRHILMRTSLYKYICENDWGNVKKAISLACKGNHAQHEISIMNKNDEEVYAIASFFPFQNLEREILAASIIFTDITRLKINESRMKDLAAIVESSEDAIYSTDREGKILTWNNAAEKIYSYYHDEVIGKDIVNLIVPQKRKKEMLSVRRKVLRGEVVPTFETERNKNGNELIRVQVSLSPLHDVDGEINGISAIARDVTYRVKAQEERDHLLARLESLIQTAPIGIAFFDKDLKFVKVNNLLASMNGVPINDHEGKSLEDVLPAEMAKKLKRKMEITKAKKKQHIFEYEGKTWSNILEDKYFQFICYPIKLSAGEYGIGLIVQDITEQKLLDKRRDDFISMASHELKTPLTSIKAFTQIMQSITEDEETKERRYLDKIEYQTDRLTKIVNDLLDITKVKTKRLIMNKEYFDFDYLVEEVIETIQTTKLTHKINVVGQTKKVIYADRERISQVIGNIVNNAVKYSPDSNVIDINYGVYNDEIRFSVRDYGIGIKKENVIKIFQNYYRIFNNAEQEYPGLGIGLYISHEIIKLHGGDIMVDSNPGKGSIFTFTLPLKQ